MQDIFPDSSRIIRPIQARRKSDGTRRKRTRRSKSASILNQRVYDSQALGLSSRDGDPLGRADYGNEQARGNSSVGSAFSTLCVSHHPLLLSWAFAFFVLVVGQRGFWFGIAFLIS